jgi:D-sedoheptulose 7-phosphate isomerase
MIPVAAHLDRPVSAAAFVEARLLERNRLSAPFFARQAEPLARACSQMADRFARGGRLLAFGERQYATDAQHVEVEFVHPVLVGKCALPALDISTSYRESLKAILRRDDMVMAFGPPEGDRDHAPLLSWASAHGAQTFALPGAGADYSLEPWEIDPFIHQELVEIVYHTLWETVHVFIEHRELGHDVGPAGFLYPFLGRERQDTAGVIAEVAASIRAKAEEDEQLRAQVGRGEGEAIARAALAIRERLRQGGGLILFGNGGSATDANDWALDCVASPKAHGMIPAVSLGAAPAVLSALANDVGADELFRRQLIAHGQPADIAIAISTSGGSRNVIAALEEARRRGLLTVALLGHDGGEVLRHAAADHAIVVRSNHIPRIQEVQASIYHVMLDLLEAVQRGDVLEPTGGS